MFKWIKDNKGFYASHNPSIRADRNGDVYSGGTVSTFVFTSDTETVTRTKLNNLVAVLKTEFNGNIDNSNIKAAAGIIGSKLDLSTPGTIGATSASAGTFTTLDITSMGSNWTNVGKTVADMGILTTVDINGGTLDGVQIGGTTATGELIVNNSSDDADGLGSQGSSGEVLTSAGTGANPTWSSAGLTSVSQGDLNTTAGEISSSAVPNYVMSTLPGGSYGFYPQIKCSNTDVASWATIISGAGTDGGGNVTGWTTYITKIALRLTSSNTMYAQQRYITASGADWFVYLKVNKSTREIENLFSAPDHPSYGNGGDYESMPHPFGNVDLDKYEIVLLNKETISHLQAESTDIDEETGTKRLATLINENYKVNLTKKEPYVPLHSGKYKRRLENGKEVVFKHMVDTIPDYITVRKLIELTQQEKSDKESARIAEELVYEQEKENKETAIISGKNKLKSGQSLTTEEVDALFGE